MRYRSRSYRSDNVPRVITAKFAGKCHCCGGDIPAGTIVDYYPGKRAIAHRGAADGNSGQCTVEIRRKHFPEYAAQLERKVDHGYVDIDTMYEDQCAEICGR